jgi:mono/diheme cytochrome c family protein
MNLKMMKSAQSITLFLCVVLLLSFNGCTYNKEDQLYALDCDTTSVTYNKDIREIMEVSCINCHGADADVLGAGLKTDSYEAVKALADDILASVIRENNPMPKNAPRLSSCKINLLRAWINQGKPQ